MSMIRSQSSFEYSCPSLANRLTALKTISERYSTSSTSSSSSSSSTTSLRFLTSVICVDGFWVFFSLLSSSFLYATAFMGLGQLLNVSLVTSRVYSNERRNHEIAQEQEVAVYHCFCK